MKIGVLGCGWLGLPFALRLKEMGYDVRGTVSSEAKALTLQDKLSIFVVKVTETGVEGDFSFFEDLDVLVVAIPPQLRSNPKADFIKKMEHLLALAKRYAIERILYVGTIAVFPNVNQAFDEDSKPITFDDKSNQLIAAEELIKNYNDTTTIIRMGGLINEERHPVTMLAKRESIANPEATINLIHQKDAIGLLCRIINKGIWGKVLHGVVLSDETKRDFYSKEAKKRGLILNFQEGHTSVGKKILVQKTLEILEYKPKVL
ncbi:MAG: NAD(P)H-binding protein [Flavobacteriales bacterium]|nr:NAD(P)H-binding protein [Flavobacteriales bacterium]